MKLIIGAADDLVLPKTSNKIKIKGYSEASHNNCLMRLEQTYQVDGNGNRISLFTSIKFKSNGLTAVSFRGLHGNGRRSEALCGSTDPHTSRQLFARQQSITLDYFDDHRTVDDGK